jgi:hypothetical protein
VICIEKKGQVTLFIIIGLLILIAIGVFFYIKTYVLEEKLDINLEQDDVAAEAKVAQDYLMSCVSGIGKDAVVLMGLHGGYVNLSDSSYTNRDFSFNPLDPTNSDGVLFHETEIPYWWYLETSNTCLDCSVTRRNVPSLQEMQDQISLYVKRQLPGCLDSFSSLSQQGITVEEKGTLRVDTAIAGDSVFIQVHYPLAVAVGESVTGLEKSYVELPVPLEKIYNAAFALVEKQVHEPFLEQAMMNLISVYSGLDQDRLPPLSALTVSYQLVFWTQPQVFDLLKTYLRTYVPLFTVRGSQNFNEISTGETFTDGFLKTFIVDLSDIEHVDDFSIDFLYSSWDPYFDITPSRGALLGASVFKNSFPLNLAPTWQTNVYEFFYDLSFPVLVSLRSDSAFNGEGYTFFVAMEGNFRDNIDLNKWSKGEGTFGPWDPNSIVFEVSEDARNYPVGADPETNETLYAEWTPPAKSLMCLDEQRLSGDIEVSTYDLFSGERIPEVGISFRCGTYRSCAIGSTDYSGKTVEQFPICGGGTLILEKQGYYPSTVDLDVYPNTEESVVATLEPYTVLDANVVLIPTSRLNGTFSSQALKALNFDMQRTDEVFLTITRVKEGPFDADFSRVLFVNGTGTQQLELISGQYTIEGMFLKNEGILIPKRTEEVGGEPITYPEIPMKPAILGGIYVDQRSALWDLSSVSDYSSVQFYMFRMQDPWNLSHLEEMGMFENYSVDFRGAIEPDLS